MSKWTDFSIDERKAMIQGVVNVMHIDEAAAENMRSSFIYGTALDFADLLKSLETLQERFRSVPAKEKSE